MKRFPSTRALRLGTSLSAHGPLRRVSVIGDATSLPATNLACTMSMPVAVQRRWVSDYRTPPQSSTSAASTQRAGEMPLGVVQITSKNINVEMDTKVPLFLYFMVTNHPEVREYTKLLTHQVDQANRRLKHENFGELYQEFGKDAGLAIKLGVVDCLQEPGLMTKFQIDPHMFPLIYFVRRKAFCDKLVGIVTESQVKEAVEAFIDYGKAESKNDAEGKSIFQQVKRQDNDDENAMTLINAARAKLQSSDVPKAKELYTKALRLAMDDKAIVDQRYGVGQKKLTPELWASLKREPCYNAAPEAMCGLAMCALTVEQKDEAMALVKRVRTEFPYAVKDMRSVAVAVVRIELMHLVDFVVEKDNFMRYLKYDDLVTDPVEFYQERLRKVVGLFVESLPGQAVEECLRLIRAEPKLLPALKDAGVVPRELTLGASAVTPARKVIRLLFEALGPNDENVLKGRKLLQLYL